MKLYAEFILESLNHDQILLASNSLKKIADLLLKANNQKESAEKMTYQILPLNCGFTIWLNNLIDRRENDDISKSVQTAKKHLEVLNKLEEIKLNCSANVILYDFFDESEFLTRLNFIIKTKNLLSDKTQKYLDSGN